MSQLLRRQARIADMQTRATKAGAKMVPEQVGGKEVLGKKGG
jgi:hypothetical protein